MDGVDAVDLAAEADRAGASRRRPSTRSRRPRRAARAADTAARPALPLELPCRTAPTPVGWREDHNRGPPWHTAVSTVQGVDRWAGFGSYREQVCSRTWHCPARPEPVKGAYGVGFAAHP